MTKKVILLMSLLVSSMCLQAQKVIIDKADSDGKRYIATEFRGFSLGCYAGNNDTTWVLVYYLNEKREIDTGRKLLIKLSDEKVITLENAVQIGPLDYESNYYSGRMHYAVHPVYYISKKDLMSIMDKGMIKIRVETNIDTFDRSEKDCKRITKMLSEEYGNIMELLQVKKTLYTDF